MQLLEPFCNEAGCFWNPDVALCEGFRFEEFLESAVFKHAEQTWTNSLSRQASEYHELCFAVDEVRGLGSVYAQEKFPTKVVRTVFSQE